MRSFRAATHSTLVLKWFRYVYLYFCQGGGRPPCWVLSRRLLFSLIPHCCKGARPKHNQPLRFLWPSWLPSNSKEWTMPPVSNRESQLLLFSEKKGGERDRLPIPSVQVDIYSSCDGGKGGGEENGPVGGGGRRWWIGEIQYKKNKKTWYYVCLYLCECACVCVRVCFSEGGLLSHGPRVLQSSKKKPDSEASRRSIVGRENPLLALQTEALQSWTSRKTSTASSLFLQHGLLHYETWQTQRKADPARWISEKSHHLRINNFFNLTIIPSWMCIFYKTSPKIKLTLSSEQLLLNDTNVCF